ncbi:MAG: hypothetical protein R3E79_07630 [Caldilineaceae bacterium]
MRPRPTAHWHRAVLRVSRQQVPRREADPVAQSKYDATAAADQVSVEQVAEVAAKHGVPKKALWAYWR